MPRAEDYWNQYIKDIIKIYSSRERELELLEFLAEFRVRVFTTYPIKGRTRKVRGTKLYKVVNLPI